MDLPPKNPADLIRKIITDERITQSVFASKLDIAQSQLSMILNGERLLTPNIIIKLANHTDISADEWSNQAKEYNDWLKSPEGQRYLARKLKNASSEELGVGVMVDNQILFAQQNEFLTINPFDQKYLQSASYDLRAGQLLRRDLGFEKEPDKEVTLTEGQSALIESLEEVIVSDQIAGRISIPSKLANEFIFVSFGLQIDPGFKGKIVAAFENRGTEPWTVKLGHTVVFSIELHALSATPTRKLLDLRPHESMPTIYGKPINRRIEAG